MREAPAFRSSDADMALIAVATRLAVARCPSQAEFEVAALDMAELLPRCSRSAAMVDLIEVCGAIAVIEWSDPASVRRNGQWEREKYTLSEVLTRVWHARAAAAIDRALRSRAGEAAA